MIKLYKINNPIQSSREMLKILYVIIAFFFSACSNLDSERFSKDFVEERRVQLTRKAELIVEGKTRLVAFCTYVSQLDSEKYPDGEYFFLEIDFADEKINIGDLQFSLLGERPVEITTVHYGDRDFFQHTHWNKGYLLRFSSVPRTEFAILSLILKIKNYPNILKFDYGFKVENIL